MRAFKPTEAYTRMIFIFITNYKYNNLHLQVNKNSQVFRKRTEKKLEIIG